MRQGVVFVGVVSCGGDGGGYDDGFEVCVCVFGVHL